VARDWGRWKGFKLTKTRERVREGNGSSVVESFPFNECFSRELKGKPFVQGGKENGGGGTGMLLGAWGGGRPPESPL